MVEQDYRVYVHAHMYCRAEPTEFLQQYCCASGGHRNKPHGSKPNSRKTYP